MAKAFMMARAQIYNLQWWSNMAAATGYSADRLAKEINISRRQLHRYIRCFFGASPQDWLNQQRLRRAGDLLKQHRSVKQVAFSLGFKQVSHFSREFKSYYGLSPVSYLERDDRQQLFTHLPMAFPPQPMSSVSTPSNVRAR